MLRRLLVVLALLAALAPATVARAEDDLDSLKFLCGTVVNSNTSWQAGSGLWLEYIVETRGMLNLCGQWIVAAEARVSGVANSAAYDQGFVVATAQRQVPVPHSGTWTTIGGHWATTVLPFGFLWNGATASNAEVAGRRLDNEYDCAMAGGYWDGWYCYPVDCPLIVDTGRDGYRLTSAEDGVLFDLDADGRPERVAWTAPDSNDAFLVMDRNGNGRIDDGTELFGNHTPAYAGSNVTTANGFEALKFLGSPANGGTLDTALATIDAGDPAFARLLLWRDANHNGISEPDELQPVSDAGLLAISTAYKTSARRDRYGNEFRQRAKGSFTDGEFYIYDVWLKRQ